MSDPIGRLAMSVAQRMQGPTGLGDRGALPVPFGREPAGASSFGDTLTRAINEVSAQQERSAEMTGAFLRGENVELHQVMAAGEEAGIALELMVELRNKVTEAYRTLVSMQG